MHNRFMTLQVLHVIVAIMATAGCATKKISLATTEKATVSLVNPMRLDEVGEVLGEAPVTIATNQVGGRIIRVSAPGKVTQYIMISDLLGVETKATLNLQDLPKEKEPAQQPQPQQQPQQPQPNPEPKKEPSESGKAGPKNLNLTHRLLLRAYQALSRQDYAMAQDLANKLAAVSPELAAPLIVKGLALMQEGRKDEARSVLTAAKALDPEDKDIDQLIEITR